MAKGNRLEGDLNQQQNMVELDAMANLRTKKFVGDHVLPSLFLRLEPSPKLLSNLSTNLYESLGFSIVTTSNLTANMTNYPL